MASRAPDIVVRPKRKARKKRQWNGIPYYKMEEVVKLANKRKSMVFQMFDMLDITDYDKDFYTIGDIKVILSSAEKILYDQSSR